MSEAIEATSLEVSETTEATSAPATETPASAEVSELKSEVKETSGTRIVNKNDNFLDMLGEDLKGNKSLADFKDVDGLAKSYLHLNSLIGKKMVDLNPEELGTIYNNLGRPEEASGYEMPDKANEEFVDWYKDTAHKLGLSQDQARNLAENYMALEEAQIKNHQVAVENQQVEWLEAIKKDFGPAFDKRIEIAKKAIEAFGGADLKAAMNETGLGNHPAIVKAFAQIGKEMLEGRLTQTDADASFGLTPADADRKISNLKKDPNFLKAFMSPLHPEHDAAIKEIHELSVIKYGNDKI